MKQPIIKIFMLGLGLAGLAGTVWVITSMIKEDPDRSGSGLARGPFKTRRAKDYQRPTQVAVDGDSTSIDFSSVGAKTAADLQLENLDPGKAGWDTELQSDSAARALTLIFDKDGVDKPIAEDFRGTPLRPDLVEIYSSDGIQVRRLQVGQSGDEVHAFDKVTFLKALPKQYGTRKIIRISRKGNEGNFSTRVIASTHDESIEEEWHQTTSVWDCNWEVSALESDGLPRLKRLTLLSHEEVTRTGKKPLFEDIAGNVLPEEIGPHDSPVTHWARSLTKIDDIDFFGHHGIAIGDANGDGLDDLYVCDCGGLPNRLYLQNPEGTTRDISAQAGVDWLESSTAALFLDLDNDGDQDLVVATVALVLVLKTTGKQIFRGAAKSSAYRTHIHCPQLTTIAMVISISSSVIISLIQPLAVSVDLWPEYHCLSTMPKMVVVMRCCEMTADYNFQMLRAPLELLRVATVGASPLHGKTTTMTEIKTSMLLTTSAVIIYSAMTPVGSRMLLPLPA